jgi:hypothetical protein
MPLRVVSGVAGSVSPSKLAALIHFILFGPLKTTRNYPHSRRVFLRTGK